MNFDPRLVALFCIVFIGLGSFSILMGYRTMRQARQQQQKAVWYKQISILTGIEYILLALAFLLNVSTSRGWIPRRATIFIAPFYLFVLLASAMLAGIVIYQAIMNTRRRAAARVATSQSHQATTTVSSPAVADGTAEHVTSQESARQAQKRRERRQKAAMARRRRAGKA